MQTDQADPADAPVRICRGCCAELTECECGDELDILDLGDEDEDVEGGVDLVDELDPDEFYRPVELV